VHSTDRTTVASISAFAAAHFLPSLPPLLREREMAATTRR
jgi:hypothetical protein